MEHSDTAVLSGRKIFAYFALFLAALFSAKGFVINPDLYIGKSAVPAATTDYLWTFFALAQWLLMIFAFIRRRMRPRTGEIVLDIYTPEAEGTDGEALRQDAESRLGARLRVHMTTAEPMLNPRNAPQ